MNLKILCPSYHNKEITDEELKEKYLLKGYPKLETSTVALIKEAIKQGINYEIIDEDRSFIKLYNNNKTEYG